MDYEKLHKDTINKLQEMVNSGKITVETARGICAGFVPESEEEKIRKWLIEMVEETRKANPTNAEHNGRCSDAIAWLEKHGEQKPVEWSEGDEDYYNAIIAKLEVTQEDAALTDNQMQFLKSLKNRVQPQPKQEWSEEDSSLLNTTILYLENTKDSCAACVPYINKCLEWLKSIHPQKQWKPSLSQLNALGVVVKGNAPDDIEEIKSLYNDLKKLREE